MPKPTIKDIIITGKLIKYEKEGGLQTRYPTGEAPIAGDSFEPMTSTQREAMEERLFSSIKSLIESTKTDHLANYYLAGSDEINQDYITRLITNEFFFYTQEPLTLTEFERLQNRIAHVVDTIPPGIHLILGSFAVKTADNKVMNITPHISSGKPVGFKFMVKNHTAPIDVRYNEADRTLPALDIRSESKGLPSITVNGIDRPLSFNNIVSCPTPGGSQLNTIVDVCLDHNKGVGNKYIMQLEEDIRDQAISHVVTSNVTHLTTSHCLGPVTHVDPEHSSQMYEPSARQFVDDVKPFGRTGIKIYETGPTQCLLLSEARQAQTLAHAEVTSYCRQLEKELMEACKSLVDTYGATDSGARQLQERSANLVAAEIDVDEKIGYIKGNLEQVREFIQQKHELARGKIQQYKDRYSEIKRDSFDQSEKEGSQVSVKPSGPQ